METILKTKDLTKLYGKRAVVDHVSLNVHKKDIYGLIGKNGAGKTTIMRMIVGLAKQNGGTIELFGKEDLGQCRKVGCAIENPALYPNMNAYNNLLYYNKLFGYKDNSNIDALLHKVGLDPKSKQKVKRFSLGMKQRLAIAVALIGNPELLVLDEPINGLDPTGIKEVRDLLLSLRDQGITILISSHILGELDKVANRYGMIDNGKLVEELTKEELEQKRSQYIEIKTNDIEKTKEVLKEKFGASQFEIGEDGTLHVMELFDEMAAINKELALQDIMVESISLSGQDLEEYFFGSLGGETA